MAGGAYSAPFQAKRNRAAVDRSKREVRTTALFVKHLGINANDSHILVSSLLVGFLGSAMRDSYW